MFSDHHSWHHLGDTHAKFCLWSHDSLWLIVHLPSDVARWTERVPLCSSFFTLKHWQCYCVAVEIRLNGHKCDFNALATLFLSKSNLLMYSELIEQLFEGGDSKIVDIIIRTWWNENKSYIYTSYNNNVQEHYFKLWAFAEFVLFFLLFLFCTVVFGCFPPPLIITVMRRRFPGSPCLLLLPLLLPLLWARCHVATAA